MTLDFILCNKKRIPLQKIVISANEKNWCAENALFIVDSIAFFIGVDVENKLYVLGVNINKPVNKLLMSIEDQKVIKTSMSAYSMKKFRNVYKRNKEFLVRESKETLAYA